VKKYLAGLLAPLFNSAQAAQSSAPRVPARIEAMEARMLYSADIAPVTLSQNEAPAVDQHFIQTPAAQTRVTELVVIDSRINEPAKLLADIASQQLAGRAIELLEVTEGEDAVAAVNGTLRELQRQGIEVSAIHIVSHGRDGEFNFGKVTINSDFLKSNAADFANWSTALTDDADILVYGCNFAQSSKGQAFSRDLAALTGADIAGNLQETGSTLLGGDWTLEFNTGAIQSNNAFTQAIENSWSHLLATGLSTPLPTHALGTSADMNTGPIIDAGINRSGGRAIAMDQNGNYVVVWTDSNSSDIYFNRYAANGSQISALQTVSTNSNQRMPAVAMAADGSFVIVWHEQFSGRLAVYGQRFEANGAKKDGQFLVASNASEDCLQANVAINGSKDFVVVWQRNNGTQQNNIYSHSYEWGSSGTIPISLSSELLIASAPDGMLSGAEMRPAVALSGTRVFLAWEGPDASSSGIFLRSFELNGSLATPTVQVNTNASNRESAPDLAVTPEGRVIVVWQEDIPSANADVTHYRIFTETQSGPRTLTAITPELTTATAASHDQSLPKVSAADSGEFIIAYQGFGQPITRTIGPSIVDANWGVFFKGFNRDGVEVIAETSVADVGAGTYFTDLNQSAVNVAWRGGKAAFAWTTEDPTTSKGNVVTRQFTINNPEIVVALPPTTTLNVDGVSRAIQVTLNSQPSDTVTLNISTNNAFGTVDTTSMTFTTSNWYLPQTIRVSALDQVGGGLLETFDVRFTSIYPSAIEYLTIPTKSFSFISSTASVHSIEVDTASDVADAPINSTLADLMAYKGADGKISLREALLAANQTPNIATGSPDVIKFSIPGAAGSTHVINTLSALPLITAPVTINGLSQSGAATGQPKVIIDGNNGAYDGFTLLSNGSGLGFSERTQIDGLGIQNFGMHGINIHSANNFITGNVLSNIGLSSIHLWSPGNTTVTGNRILNNIINTSGYAGIHIDGADDNFITSNVVTNGNLHGIIISDYVGAGAVHNLVQRNYVGGNAGSGVVLTGSLTSQNSLFENYIGYDENGGALGNTYNGIQIEYGANDNNIGGIYSGNGNYIAYNSQVGVRITDRNPTSPTTINNRVLGNSIFTNGSLGIDLTAYDSFLGVFPNAAPNSNDIGDPFFGPNGYINSPVLFAASDNGGTPLIKGQLSAAPNAFYHIEFFSSPAANNTGFGDGATYLGFQNVATDASGIANFTYSSSIGVTLGHRVSATSTRASDNADSDLQGTSEFSNAVRVQAPPRFLSPSSLTNINENTSAPVQFNLKQLLVDPSASGITFSLDPAGFDNSYFGFDQATGVLTIYATNYESLLFDVGGPRDHNRAVSVIATDGFFTTRTNFGILYDDVNEPIQINVAVTPTGTEDTVFRFTGVNTITITDPDEGTTPSTVLTATPPPVTPITFTITARLDNGSASGIFALNNLPPLLEARIAPSYLASELRLLGTLADINQALTYLEYTPALNNTADIKFAYSANDQGSGVSLGGVTNSAKNTVLTLTPVNDPTVLSWSPALISIPSGASFQIGNSVLPSLLISDVDIGNGNMQLILSTTSGTLIAPVFPGITFQTPSTNTPILVINGNITNLQVALNGITFSAAPGAKGYAPLTITVVDTSTGASLLPIVVKDLDIYIESPPNIVGASGYKTIVEGTATPTLVFDSAVLNDDDGPDINGLRFHYPAPLLTGEQFLLPAPVGAMTSPTFDPINGIVSIFGQATIAQYQSYIQQIAYLNTSTNPSDLPRAFSVEVWDGAYWSNLETTTVYVTALNGAPSITAPSSMQVAYGQEINLSSQAISSPLAISDNDAGTSKLSLTISVDFGLLRFENTQGLLVIGDVAGSSSLNISGTLQQLSIALTQLFYRANLGFEGDDTATFIVDDFGGSKLPAGISVGSTTSTITALAGTPPTVLNTVEVVTFIEDAGAALVLPSLTLSGSNYGTIESATLTIAGGYDLSSDRLSVGGAGVTWDSQNGLLTIVRSLPIDEFQKLLQQITFENTSDNPATGKREILIDVFDGLQHSQVEAVFVNVVATNDAPTMSAVPSMTTAEDSTLQFSRFGLGQFADVDSNELVLVIETTNGSFTWAGASTRPTTVELSTTGATASARLTGTALDVNAWASQLAFVPDANFNGVSQVTWRLNDREATPRTISKQSSISVTPVNDNPGWQNNASMAVRQGEKITLASASVSVTDVEDQATALTYKISALPIYGQLMLNGRVLSAVDTFSQSDIDKGLVEYRHDSGLSTIDSMRLQAIDSQGAASEEKSISISIATAPVLIVAPSSTPPPSGIVRTTTSTVSADPNSSSVKSVVEGNTGDPATSSNSSAAMATNVAANSTRSTQNQSRTNQNSTGSQLANPTAIDGNNTPNAASTNQATTFGAIGSEKFSNTAAAAKEQQAYRPDNSSNVNLTRQRSDSENIEYAGIMRAVLTDKSFFDDVQKNREQSNQTIKFDRNVVATSTAVSAGLSIGYVIWLVRGGALMSSLLASVPAWRLMDPLPVLGSMGDNDQDDDDESLDAMIESSKAKKLQVPEPNLPLAPAHSGS
jgi:Domain of unknown function (DUF4347)/Cadherin-like/Right handed beta helix region